MRGQTFIYGGKAISAVKSLHSTKHYGFSTFMDKQTAFILNTNKRQTKKTHSFYSSGLGDPQHLKSKPPDHFNIRQR